MPRSLAQYSRDRYPIDSKNPGVLYTMDIPDVLFVELHGKPLPAAEAIEMGWQNLPSGYGLVMISVVCGRLIISIATTEADFRDYTKPSKTRFPTRLFLMECARFATESDKFARHLRHLAVKDALKADA